jgi:hypothetical protein
LTPSASPGSAQHAASSPIPRDAARTAASRR